MGCVICWWLSFSTEKGKKKEIILCVLGLALFEVFQWENFCRYYLGIVRFTFTHGSLVMSVACSSTDLISDMIRSWFWHSIT